MYVSLERIVFHIKLRSTNIKIFVSNLSYDTTEEELRQEFESFGGVTSIILVKDKFDGRSRGFGFVEMLKISEGHAAITGLSGKMLKECTLVVNPARDWSEYGGSKPRRKR